LPPLEAWEKVFVQKSFLATYHARFGCIGCHGGTGGTDDLETAHQGIVRDPHPTNSETCQLCHVDVAEAHVDSLHWDQEGYKTALAARSDEADWDQLMVAYDNHCSECHASCGQCHVSRPTVNGGGLLDGHNVKTQPPMNNTCTGCHGSRVNDEYKGKNEAEAGGLYPVGRIPADVHYNPGGMSCFDCHTEDEMHGVSGDYDHRYDGPPEPSCTQPECHTVSAEDEILLHDDVHLEKLSCQVCHAAAYKNCYNCHVQQTDDGRPYYVVDPSQMAFKIGYNPIQSPERPWEYVTLRHVPVARDSFAYYGEDLLSNFDNRPTWVYATPHTIQRITPQNRSCDACHGNADIFLTEDDVPQDEREANRNVILYELADIGFSHEGLVDCQVCHRGPLDHYAGQCSNCHTTTETWTTIRFTHSGFVDCQSCHTSPANHYDGQCSNCHTSTARWGDVVFDHTDLTDCASCHTSPANHYDGQCSDCHTSTVRWTDLTFDHTGYTDCQSCHGRPANHYDGQCSDCHTSTVRWSDLTFDHTGYTDCQSCHGRPAGHYAGQCSDCHTSTETWSSISFSHDGLTDCQSCHPRPADHYDGQCSDCHTSTETWSSISFSHDGLTDCQSCHPRPADHYDGQCSDCHTSTETWSSISFSHDGLTDCQSCHPRPADHYDGQCSDCHTSTETWGDVTFDHTSYTDCRACHTLPEEHSNTNAQCSNCHYTDTWSELKRGADD